MREERRKEPRARRRMRASIESPSGRASGTVTGVSAHGLGVTVDSVLSRGARVVVTLLLPAGRVTFEAIVRHAKRTAEPGGGFRSGLELAEPAPEPYRRFVREELAAVLARSGAGADGVADDPPLLPPPARGRRGIPSPIAMRAAAAAPPPPAPAAAPAKKSGRRSTPRRLRPKTPSRGSTAAASAPGKLGKVEPGQHGIATARIAEGTEIDALAAAAVMRDAAAEAVDGLLPAGSRLALVSADVTLEEGAANAGPSVTAAARLGRIEVASDTLIFDVELTRRGRAIARGHLTFRVT